MTAVVFLKKAYKLSQDKRRLEVIIPREDPGEATDLTSLTSLNRFARAASTWAAAAPRGRNGGSTGGSLLDTTDEDDQLMLRFTPLQPTITPSASTPTMSSKKSTTKNVGDQGDQEEEEDEKKKNKKEKKEGDIPVKIPEWDEGVFWKRYGNKIRVGQSALMLYTGRK